MQHSPALVTLCHTPSDLLHSLDVTYFLNGPLLTNPNEDDDDDDDGICLPAHSSVFDGLAQEIRTVGRPGVFQASSDCSPMSERPRTTVPVGLLRPCRRC